MFFSLSKTIAKFGGFRLGMGIRLTKKNAAIMMFVWLFVSMLQLTWYMLVVCFWLFYAMFYAVIWCFKKILCKNRKISSGNKMKNASEGNEVKKLSSKNITIIVLSVVLIFGMLIFSLGNGDNNVNGDIGETESDNQENINNDTIDKENNQYGNTDKENTDKENTDKENTDKENTDKENTDKENTDKENTDKEDTNKENTENSDNNQNDNGSNSVGGNNGNEEDKDDNSSNTENKTKYILNTKSKKIHYPSCHTIKNMSEENKQEYIGDKEALFDQGYTECGVCH